MTRIWLVNWTFQSRITLWCRHKSTNVSMGLCWQMPKFIVWRLWFIYFDHRLLLKPSIGKRRKQSCTPNIKITQLTNIKSGKLQDNSIVISPDPWSLISRPKSTSSLYEEELSRRPSFLLPSPAELNDLQMNATSSDSPSE